ncbi:MAG: hypothetical protein WCQ21_37645, partial [Verrucomicrobiota bacterium]
MPKTIITTIDSQGNVHLDFSGYSGDCCLKEEEWLRHELAALGLRVRSQDAKRKPTPASQRADGLTNNPGPRLRGGNFV